MKNYVQPGHVMTVPAPVDTISGDVVVVGAAFGIAAYSALAGQPLEIKLGGIYDSIPKTSAQAWTIGAALYWDATAKVATTVAAGNIKIGIAAAAAANPSAFGTVRFNASF